MIGIGERREKGMCMGVGGGEEAELVVVMGRTFLCSEEVERRAVGMRVMGRKCSVFWWWKAFQMWNR